MTFPTSPLLVQALRYYSHRAGPSRGSAFGAAAAVGYCCVAFSAPFAGAAVVSQRAREGGRYAKMYVLLNQTNDSMCQADGTDAGDL